LQVPKGKRKSLRAHLLTMKGIAMSLIFWFIIFIIVVAIFISIAVFGGDFASRIFNILPSIFT